MIFNKKSIKVPSLTKKKFNLDSFCFKGDATLDDEFCSITDVSTLINFDSSSGALKKGVGISNFKGVEFIDENNKMVKPLGVYYYKRYDETQNVNDDRLIVYASNKKLYSLKLSKNASKLNEIENSSFEKKPTAINYNYSGDDVLIISSSEDGLFILKGDEISKIEDAPPITSMCIHSERLFATTVGEGTSLWFSDDYNPTNWFISLDEGGYIELIDGRGKLLKVISFLDYVYVFRSYGISRVSAFGEQAEFSVDNLYNNIGKIYGNTVTVSGSYVFFLTSTGLYRFNGIDTVKVLPYYNKFLDGVDNEEAKGVYFNGKLYLLVNAKLFGDYIEKVLIVYDIYTKTSYIAKDLGIEDLEIIQGSEYEVVVATKQNLAVLNNDGKRFETPLKKVWISGASDYSIPTKNKRLDKITLYASEAITLVVKVDNKEYLYQLNSGDNSVLVGKKGKDVLLKIISKTPNPKIVKPTLYFSYFKENLW